MGDGLEVDRRGDPCAAGGFDVGSEADEQATAGTAAGFDVVAFDPVVDDVGADAERGGDVADGAFVVVGGCGVVDLWEVDRRGDALAACRLDVRPERDAPLVVEPAACRQPSPVDPVDDRAVADAEPASDVGDGELAVFK